MSNDITSVQAKTKIEKTAAVMDGDLEVTPAVLEEVTRTVNFNVPSSLEGLRSTFGDEVVASQAQAALVIALQAFIRRHAGKEQGELQALVNAWKPETRAAVSRKSASEKIDDLIGGLDADAKKALIAKLKAA